MTSLKGQLHFLSSGRKKKAFPNIFLFFLMLFCKEKEMNDINKHLNKGILLLLATKIHMKGNNLTLIYSL